MRKYLISAVVSVLAVFLAVLAGCGLVDGFEKDLTVVLKVNNEYYETHTVNIFNNAVVSELPTPDDEDEIFLGWTPKADYVAWVDDEGLILENKQVIRYNDVKDYVKGENPQVTLYAVFGAKPVYDLVIGWYAKTGTTGLDENNMGKYTQALTKYVADNYGTLKIDIREYSSTFDVATVGSTVNKDGDVDILIGMGTNITSQGGIETKELISDYMISGKSRNIARLTDGDMVEAIFAWMQTDAVRALFN